MITEDYVSFETAKLLKDKGFDWLESPFYSEQDRDEWRKNNSYTVPNEEYNPELPFDSETLTLVAPHVSIQMAMKWLRKVHNLHIITLPYAPFDRYSYHPGFEADMVYIVQLFRGIIPIDEIGRSVIRLTPEEACEAGIKYCLENLI